MTPSTSNPCHPKPNTLASSWSSKKQEENFWGDKTNINIYSRKAKALSQAARNYINSLCCLLYTQPHNESKDYYNKWLFMFGRPCYFSFTPSQKMDHASLPNVQKLVPRDTSRGVKNTGKPGNWFRFQLERKTKNRIPQFRFPFLAPGYLYLT